MFFVPRARVYFCRLLPRGFPSMLFSLAYLVFSHGYIVICSFSILHAMSHSQCMHDFFLVKQSIRLRVKYGLASISCDKKMGCGDTLDDGINQD